jgi:hypothetical protein
MPCLVSKRDCTTITFQALLAISLFPATLDILLFFKDIGILGKLKTLPYSVQVNVLRETFYSLLEGHSILRSFYFSDFSVVSQQIKQMVAASPVCLVYFQLTFSSSKTLPFFVSRISEGTLAKHANADSLLPFNLNEGLPIRMHVYENQATQHVFAILVVCHPIAADVRSIKSNFSYNLDFTFLFYFNRRTASDF